MNYEQKNSGTIGKTKSDRSYIEELFPSECFVYQHNIFVLTQDHKKDGSRLAISLIDGCSRWFSASSIIEKTAVYIMNEDGHLILVENNVKTNQENSNI